MLPFRVVPLSTVSSQASRREMLLDVFAQTIQARPRKSTTASFSRGKGRWADFPSVKINGWSMVERGMSGSIERGLYTKVHPWVNLR